MREAQNGGMDWFALIPEGDWCQYRKVLDAALRQRIPFALGGGFAFSHYSRRWRDTKDIDLYVLPADRERLIDILGQVGFADLFDEKPYDRRWIYRGVRQGVITDVIWAMANHRAAVDESWLERAPAVSVRGLTLKLLPVEELIWAKLYVVQRDRCDWPDLLNILNVQGAAINWSHLLERVDGDERVLGAMVNLFAWMCPGRAAGLPEWVWARLGLVRPCQAGPGDVDPHHVAWLDARDWFGPKKPREKGDAIAPD